MTKSNWWTAFGQALHAVPGNRKLIGLLDANAATGTITSAGIGNYAVEEEDTNGQLLRALLDANSLWLPNTFPCCHTGPAVTWISSAAALPQGSRLDYVVLPLEWLGAEVSSMTVPDIDACAGLDHFALSVRVSWALTSTRKARRPRTTPSRIDWAAVRKCRDPEVWRAIFTDLPQPAWNVDVHTHWHQLHSALLKQILKFFPRPKSRPRQPYIDAATWELRNQKQAIRRQFAFRAHLCSRLLRHPFRRFDFDNLFELHLFGL